MRAGFVSALSLVFGLVLTAWLVTPDLQRPLHADEAVQWSLLTAPEPHSANQDRLHGPLLGLVAKPVLQLFNPSLESVSESQLRLIPLGWTLLILLSLPWIAPAGWGLRHPLIFILLPLLALPAARFIQEWLMASLLVLAGCLAIRAQSAAKPRGWLLAAGIGVGLALACKVSAVTYLGFALAALYFFGERSLIKKLFVPGLVAGVTWAIAQSSFLTDLPALGTWWLQLGRAFGLATGVTEPALPMVDPLAWILTGGTILGLVVFRWLLRSALGAWKSADIDPWLACLVGVYLFHLVLPYKTPWLLATLDLACLAGLAPRLLLALRAPWGRTLLLGVGVVSLATLPKWASVARYDYVETHPDVPRLALTLKSLASPAAAAPWVIAVEQGHVWPLPFYLREYRVAYGALPVGTVAQVRLFPGEPGEAPLLTGYQPFPFLMRTGEVWWAYIQDDQIEAFRSAWAKTAHDL